MAPPGVPMYTYAPSGDTAKDVQPPKAVAFIVWKSARDGLVSPGAKTSKPVELSQMYNDFCEVSDVTTIALYNVKDCVDGHEIPE